MPNQPTLSTLVEQAYDKLANPTSEPTNSEQAAPQNAVEAAFGALHLTTDQPSPPDKTAQAYAQVPSDRALQRFDQMAAARGQTQAAFSGIAPRTVLSLMNCQNLPPKGMVSALAPAALALGQFSLLQDVRIDDKSLKARYPTTSRSATGLPGGSGSSRGIWSGTLNGTTYVVGAWYDGTKVGIYFSTDGIAFTAASQTSGAFGDTRMSDTGIPFAFQVATNPFDGLDYLVIQNGTDAPRVFGTTAFFSSYLRVIKQFAPPTWASSTSVQSVLGTSYLSTLASATGSTGLVCNVYGSSPSQSLAIEVETTVTTGTSNVVLDFGAGGLSFGDGSQILFVSDQATMNAWDSWKIEVSANGSTYYTLADPTSGTYNAPVRVGFTDPLFTQTSTGGGLNGEEVVGFDESVLSPNVTNSLRYMRLTWMSAAPSSPFTTTIHAMYESGAQLAFDQEYMLSYAGLGGLSESAGVVMDGFSAKTNSMMTGLPSGVYVRVPYVAGIYYDHVIPVQGQSSTDLGHGCDSLYIYRQDGVSASSGNGDFFLFGSYAIGEYSGGAWIYENCTFASAGVPAYFSSYVITSALWLATALNVALYAPDAYAMVMPNGLSMAQANGRTFVGGKSFYAVSEYGQGFRFRPALAFVNGAPLERSATYVSLAGQTVVAFATPSGSALNSQTVFFWTAIRTYACGGFDGYSLSRPAVVFEVGCISPKSVAQYKDAIFWLDDNRQIRRFNYGRSFLYGYSNANAYDLAPAISRMVVDDQLYAIPAGQLPWVCGVASYDRFYLFYAPSGGSSNTLALVLEETLQAFVQDSLSVGGQAVCAASLSPGKVLLLAGKDGGVYTHEDSTSSTAHSVAITSAEVSEQMWHPQFFGRVGLVADVQSGQTASVTVTGKPNNSDSSSIDLATNATNQVWRWASRAESDGSGQPGNEFTEATTQPGIHGASAQVALSLTMTPQTRIYSIAIETSPALPGADQL